MKSSKKVSRNVPITIYMVSMLIISILITVFVSNSSNITALAATTFTKSGGWFETAYAEWGPVSGATGYNVY